MPTEIQSSSLPPRPPKDKALLIRHKYVTPLSNWLNDVQSEIEKLFAQDFDLTVIDQDFDLAAVCDAQRPDIIILDSPGLHRSAAVNIANPRAHPEIPRVAYLNQDPHDTARALFFQSMDQLGIDAFFATGGAAAIRQSPDLEGKVYFAPLFCDGDVYKDYGLSKDIPVSVFGWNTVCDFYHWRLETVPEMMNYFPTLVYTHPGYGGEAPRFRFPVMGVDYAKFLNRSHFSVSDTTRLDYIVRKHLEIPASGAVLISPATPDLAYYGFRDMENCILGSGMELFQKIAAVANDPALHRTIQKNGHDLVHSRFTNDKWHYIKDWLDCHRKLGPDEMIQQQGVFGPFAVVPRTDDAPVALHAPFEDSDFSKGMKAAWDIICKGGLLNEAETTLKSIAEWLGHLNEPWLLLGVIALLRGNLKQAKEHFLHPVRVRLARDQKNTCLDPEEIAWLMMTGVLMGDGELVRDMRSASTGVSARGLRRMTWLFETQGRMDTPPSSGVQNRLPGDRLSIHWTAQSDLDDWMSLTRRIMGANQ